jgi:hypothetical protein
VYKRRHLQARQPSICEGADDRHLSVGWDEALLKLKAIAWANVAELNATG